MNNEKPKEWIADYLDRGIGVFTDKDFKQKIKDLIKYVRQLEKEKDNPYFRVNTDGSVEKMNCSGCAELLSLITIDKIDGSTLVECLNAVGLIIIDGHFERSEELCAWVEKIAVLSPTKKLEEK